MLAYVDIFVFGAQFQLIVCGQGEIVANGVGEAIVVGVTRGDEVGDVGGGDVVRAGVFGGGITGKFPAFVVAGRYVIVESGHFRAEVAWRAGDAPRVVLSGGARVVEIVYRSNERQARARCVPHAEKPSQISVSSAAAGLCVEDISAHIFTFEPDVHHILFVAEILAGQHAALSEPVVDGYVFHRIGSEIVEHYPFVAFEEVFTVKQQAFDVFAVYVNLAAVAKLHSRKLFYERVEH